MGRVWTTEWHDRDRYSAYRSALSWLAYDGRRARLIVSAGLTDRGLLSGQLRPVDGRFKLTTTMKTTLAFAVAAPALLLRTYTTALFTHAPTPMAYISHGANRTVNTGNALIYVTLMYDGFDVT